MTKQVRAGGGGGGHGGGGGGSHSSGGSSHSYGGGGYSSGGSGSGGDIGFGGLVFIVVVFIIIYVVKNRLDKISSGSRDDLSDAELAIAGLRRPVANNESLESVSTELRAKIETAFRTVQQSWSQKRIDLMRRFISDGVYQRFNAQFTMMGLLGQTNPISNVVIHSIDQVKSAPAQGVYDSIDIRIEASADDQFISTMHPELNSPGGNDRFVEYWSFIRRKDYQAGKHIYHASTCPKCSAPLDQKMMQDARCHYCGTYINNGEFDWVLAEITQEENYSGTSDIAIPPDLLSLAPMTSIQILEDKASNAFTQVLIARATGDVKALGRFCLPEIAAKLSVGADRRVYDRLYLNSVEAKSVTLAQGFISASVQIIYSFHDLDDGGDGTEMTRAEAQLLLVHKPSGAEAKGTIYANACATCGAPQKDSISHTCAYCGAVLSDVTREWIVGGINEV